MQVATEDVPIPYNGTLELEAIPSEQDIVDAVMEVMYRE
jgi:pyruvate/2-oxoglutarate/acetoin dehydrogenase E1 component